MIMVFSLPVIWCGRFINNIFPTATWETCISYDLPLPLMTWVSDEIGDEYLIELTSYNE